MLIHKIGNFLLSKQQIQYFLIISLSLRINTVNVHQKMLTLKIRTGQIKKEGAKGKIPPWLVGSVECINKFGVIFYF